MAEYMNKDRFLAYMGLNDGNEFGNRLYEVLQYRGYEIMNSVEGKYRGRRCARGEV